MATTTIVGQRWKVYVYADSTALVPGDGEGMVLSGITGFEASRVFVMGDGTSTVAQLVAAKQYQAIYAYADVDDVVLAGGYQYAVTDIPGSTLYVQIITGDGTHTIAELVANIVSSVNGITVVTGNYTILETDKKIVVNTASAVTLTITEGLSLYKDIEIQRIVASTNAVTLARSGSETINGVTTFITHDVTISSVVNKNIIKITKTGATAWTWTDGIISGSAGVKYWEKKHTGYSVYRFTGGIPAAGGSVAIAHGLTSSKMRTSGGFFSSGTDTYFFDMIWEDGSRTAHVFARAAVTNLTIYSDATLTAGLVGSPFELAIEYQE